jgi:type IV pilus assembly protein PilP
MIARVRASGGPGSALSLALLLVGCGQGDGDELQTYIDRVKQSPPAQVEPIPDIQPVDIHVYEPAGRRDPFVMDTQVVSVVETVDELAPDPMRPKEELESHALDSLQMVGTLAQKGQLWGLVRTRQGLVYRVRVGNHLGMNNGQISEITERSIRLTELVSDGSGKWRERPAEIALPR